MVHRHEHVCTARPTTSSNFVDAAQPTFPLTVKETKSCQPFSMAVNVDPDNLLPCETRTQFLQSLRQYDRVFKSDLPRYNGAVGPIHAHVNKGPVEPSRRKVRLPLCSKNQL